MRRLLLAFAVLAVSVVRADISPAELTTRLEPIVDNLFDLEVAISNLSQDTMSQFGITHTDLENIRTAINSAKGSVDNAVSHLGTLVYNLSTLIDRVNAGNTTLTSINQGVSGILSNIDDVLTAIRAVRDNTSNIYTELYSFGDAFDTYAGSAIFRLSIIDSNVATIKDNTQTLIDVNDYYLSSIDAALASGLSDILSRLAVLTSISESTANTYTNVVSILQTLNSGVVVDLGPTGSVSIAISPPMRAGLRWVSFSSGDSVSVAPTVNSAETTSITVPAGGYMTSALRYLALMRDDTRYQRKSGVISALADIWTTNYLGTVQQSLLVDQLAAAQAETNYLYSVQADMLRAITNSLSYLNATNNQQSAQTEEAYSEMATSVSNQVTSLDMEQNSDRFDSDTAGFSPSLSSDALSAFDAVKSGLGDFATRAERKAQEGANGIKLGITLPQYAVGETTLLNGDEFLGAVGDPDGANGVHRFFTSIRSVFLALWTVAYLGVAFGLWRFLVGLWHRITSLFGETVDKSMMV